MVQLNRRQFIRAAALSGAAVISAGLLGGCGSPGAGPSASLAQSATSEGSASASSAQSASAQPSSVGSPSATASAEKGRIAVVFFSQTGNTAGIASHIASHLQAEAIELKAAEPYTSADLDYSDSSTRATVEQNAPETRPALAELPSNLDAHDAVFLGYPIWWGKAPRIMCTFAESCDLSGKTIVPFCTSGSSDIGSTADELAALASSSATWIPGKRFAAGTDSQVVSEWVDSLAL